MALPRMPPMDVDPVEFNSESDEARNGRAGVVCEMKTYETRHDSRGEKITLQVGTRHREVDDNRDHEAAFVLLRKYDQYNELQETTFAIRSPYAKAALRKVIVRYPGIDFHTAVVTIVSPPRCLFHYRKELEAYQGTLDDAEAVKHLDVLLAHMSRTFAAELQTWENLMECHTVPRSLPFFQLWMAFRPGSYIYRRVDGTDQVLRLKSMSRCACSNPICWRSRWVLKAEMIRWNGTQFGYDEMNTRINPYEGDMRLMKLKICPLQYHQSQRSISATLAARGLKYAQLKGTNYKYYDGSAASESGFFEEECPIRSRVMIDTKVYYAIGEGTETEHDSELEPDKYEEGDTFEVKLTTEDFIICDYTIPGFCLTTKRWYTLKVDTIEDIDFNMEAFESLLLPKHQKQMIHSLVKVHTTDGAGFDDLIKGKGKGMVFLLHGVPGTGKTLTAEGVADYTKRPLYTMSCGELGTDNKSVEVNLKRALDLATTWNAIILIDEADVFLEARSSNDLKRNGLVSIFLRLLEYYQGILILTTNRVKVFDPAIKSRIHLAIKYQALPASSRRDLWRVFIRKACPRALPEWLDDDCLDLLARDNLNGRQIKNAVRTAQALAMSDECDVNLTHIEQSLDAMRLFDADFEEKAPTSDGELINECDQEGERGSTLEESSRKRRRIF